MFTYEQMQEVGKEVQGIIDEGMTGDQLRDILDKARHETQLRADANRLRGFASEVSQLAVDLRLTGDERELFSDFSRAVQDMYSDRMAQAGEVQYEVCAYPFYLDRAQEEDTTGRSPPVEREHTVAGLSDNDSPVVFKSSHPHTGPTP